MKRKGQYMAVEAVMGIGISLIIAVAAVGIFATYQDTVNDIITRRHFTVVSSQVLTATYNLRDAESGSYVGLKLPEAPGGGGYTVSMDDRKLTIISGDQEHMESIQGLTWVDQFNGTVDSSKIKIVKRQNDILLRPS
ncbi:MAG: hypothetical protein ABEJ36_05225 [Candidatus Nanosalina sp.]